MSDPSSELDEVAAAAVLRAERRLRLLEELTGIGMEIARSLRPGAVVAEPAAQEAPGAGPAGDLADAFAKVSRAVRLTIALESKTDQELRKLRKPPSAFERMLEESNTAKRRSYDADNRRSDHIARIEAIIGDAIDREVETEEAYCELNDALEQRLDWDEAYMSSQQRPLRETVERLCHDLGLSPDWSCWTGEGWSWTAEEPPFRPPWSPFIQPSRRPIVITDEKHPAFSAQSEGEPVADLE